MSIDNLFEFGRIYIDQSLNFVFEGRAILRVMPSNSFLICTSNTEIVPFWIGRLSRFGRNDQNPVVLDQYRQYFL